MDQGVKMKQALIEFIKHLITNWLAYKKSIYFEDLIHTISIKIAQGVNDIYSMDGLFEFQTFFRE